MDRTDTDLLGYGDEAEESSTDDIDDDGTLSTLRRMTSTLPIDRDATTANVRSTSDLSAVETTRALPLASSSSTIIPSRTTLEVHTTHRDVSVSVSSSTDRTRSVEPAPTSRSNSATSPAGTVASSLRTSSMTQSLSTSSTSSLSTTSSTSIAPASTLFASYDSKAFYANQVPSVFPGSLEETTIAKHSAHRSSPQTTVIVVGTAASAMFLIMFVLLVCVRHWDKRKMTDGTKEQLEPTYGAAVTADTTPPDATSQATDGSL